MTLAKSRNQRCSNIGRLCQSNSRFPTTPNTLPGQISVDCSLARPTKPQYRRKHQGVFHYCHYFDSFLSFSRPFTAPIAAQSVTNSFGVLSICHWHPALGYVLINSSCLRFVVPIGASLALLRVKLSATDFALKHHQDTRPRNGLSMAQNSCA